MAKILSMRFIKCLEKLAANRIAGGFGERFNKYDKYTHKWQATATSQKEIDKFQIDLN